MEGVTGDVLNSGRRTRKKNKEQVEKMREIKRRAERKEAEERKKARARAITGRLRRVFQ